MAEPREIAPGLILIKQGTHEFEQVKADGIIARYFQVASSVTLYLGEDITVIDSGGRFYRSVIEERIRQYVDPADVKFFIATHYHHDHLDNSDLFQNANRILDTGMVTPGGDMTVYDDATKIPGPKGVEIFGTPGHVRNHISARITINGTRYVCSGDAVRYDILSGECKPGYIDDQYINSVRKVFDMADVIIPGHGDLIEVEKGNLPWLIR